MKIKSIATGVMLLAGLLAFLSGCGGGNSSEASAASVNTAETEIGSGGAAPGSEAAIGNGASGGAAGLTCGGVGSDMPSSPGATLVVQIGGTEAGVSHDVLEVNGRARIGGILQVMFEEPFVPSKGQRFTVVKASCLAGSFARVTANKGAVLGVTQDATSLTVTVQ